MITLLFATNNKNKLREASSIFQKHPNLKIISLQDVQLEIEIPEDFNTLEENAYQKASFIFHKSKLPCFADDSGLEIEALNGEPGVFSARYSGIHSTDEKNVQKVLTKLSRHQHRQAQFRTVIQFISNEHQIRFEGIVKGTIIDNIRGQNGFGYDPIFIPNGYQKTFAEMTLEEKNSISHRKIALTKMDKFLETLNLNDLSQL